MGKKSSLFIWFHLLDHAFLGVLDPVDLALVVVSIVLGSVFSERGQVVDVLALESLLIQLYASHVQ